MGNSQDSGLASRRDRRSPGRANRRSGIWVVLTALAAVVAGAAACGPATAGADRAVPAGTPPITEAPAPTTATPSARTALTSTTRAPATTVTTPATTGTAPPGSSSAPLPVGAYTSSPPPAFPAGACHARGLLPDPACTPGATNPAVSQADIGTTICMSGWTARVRPPESYTEALKREQLQAYGDTSPISAYEEDHLVPLELGGAPSDARNLWPELGASPNRKDSVENAGRAAVCDGRISLVAAQRAIAGDWVAFGSQLGVARS